MNLQRGILPAVLLGGIAAAAFYANRSGRSPEGDGTGRKEGSGTNGGIRRNGVSHNGNGAAHTEGRRLRHRRTPQEQVRVTAHGHKYHRDGCPLLHGSSRSIPIREAILSYEPCRACHPPVTS